MSEPLFDRAADLLRTSKHPIAFTGAGISAESGISTFRASEEGLWSKWSPEELATPWGFKNDRELVWGWYVWRLAKGMSALPNAGHDALAMLEQRWPNFAVITQNVDELHERAGSKRIAHLHGLASAFRCFSCAAPATFDVPLDAADNPQLRMPPPACLHCGDSIRPGVVWFGEGLPQDQWNQADDWAMQCDLMLVIGTSGIVQPAASLVDVARRNGAKIILIDPSVTSHATLADVHLREAAGVALPKLLQRL